MASETDAYTTIAILAQALPQRGVRWRATSSGAAHRLERVSDASDEICLGSSRSGDAGPLGQS
jgi:hypothetical protein